MDYEALLQQARDNIQNADFTALRQASTSLATYNPYGGRTMQKEFSDAVKAKNWQAAVEAGEAALEDDFLNIDMHFGMAYCFKQMGKTGHEQWHGRFGAGLLRSIMNSGDGKTPETAFHVLYFREVYDVLGAMRLRLSRQSLIHQPDGEVYDLMDCITEDGGTMGLYFNITAYFGYEFRNLGGDSPA